MNREIGTFINGKNQVIEMLSHLTLQEREKIIDKIKQQNPQLAKELLEQSINFKSLPDLDDFEIKKVISYSDASILGVALKALPLRAQRKILSLCDRPYAEKAYQIMCNPIHNEKININRACERINNTISNLVKNNQLKKQKV